MATSRLGSIGMLREARARQGVTQEALAEALGFRQTDISKTDRGVRRLDVLELHDRIGALGLSFVEFGKQLPMNALRAWKRCYAMLRPVRRSLSFAPIVHGRQEDVPVVTCFTAWLGGRAIALNWWCVCD